MDAVYNLMQYFKNNYSSYNYCVNGFHKDTPNEAIALNETTSTPQPWIERVDYTIQIFSRAFDPLTAKEQIRNVFSIVNNYYDVTLPEVTLTLQDGTTTTISEVKAYQMIPLQKPFWFGYDQNGFANYVFNLKITTR